MTHRTTVGLLASLAFFCLSAAELVSFASLVGDGFNSRILYQTMLGAVGYFLLGIAAIVWSRRGSTT
jgi:hypothetical protein